MSEAIVDLALRIERSDGGEWRISAGTTGCGCCSLSTAVIGNKRLRGFEGTFVPAEEVAEILDAVIRALTLVRQESLG